MAQSRNCDPAHDEPITEGSSLLAQPPISSDSFPMPRSPILQPHFNTSITSIPHSPQRLHHAHNTGDSPSLGVTETLEPPETDMPNRRTKSDNPCAADFLSSADMNQLQLIQENANIKTEIADKSSELFEIYGEKGKLAAEVESLKAQIMDLKKKLHTAEAHVNQADSNYTELQGDKTALEAAKEAVEVQFKALQQKYEVVATQTKGKDRRIEKDKAEKDKLKLNIGKLEQTISNLQDELSEKSNQIEHSISIEELETHTSGLHEDLAKLQETLGDREDQVKELSENLAKLQEELRHKEVQIKDLKGSNKKLRNEKKNANEKAQHHQEAKQKLLVSVKTLENQLAAARISTSDRHATSGYNTDNETTSETSHDMEITPRPMGGRSLRSEFGGSIGSRDHSPTKSTFGGSAQSDHGAAEDVEAFDVDDSMVTLRDQDVIGVGMGAQTGTSEILDQQASGSVSGTHSDELATRSSTPTRHKGIGGDVGNEAGLFNVAGETGVGQLPAAQNSKDVIETGMGTQDEVVGQLPAAHNSEDVVETGLGTEGEAFGITNMEGTGHLTVTKSSEVVTGKNMDAQAGIVEVIEKPGKAEFWTVRKIMGVVLGAGLAMLFFGLCYFWWTQGNAAQRERVIWTTANGIGNSTPPFNQTQWRKAAMQVYGAMNESARARAGYLTPEKVLMYHTKMSKFYAPGRSGVLR